MLLSRLIFDNVHILQSQIGRRQTYRWYQMIDSPHLLAGNGYLNQLIQFEDLYKACCLVPDFYPAISNAITVDRLDIVEYLWQIMTSMQHQQQLNSNNVNNNNYYYNSYNYHKFEIDVLFFRASRLGRFDIIKYFCSLADEKWSFYTAMVESIFSENLELLKYLAGKFELIGAKPYLEAKNNIFDTAAFVGNIGIIQWIDENWSIREKCYRTMYRKAVVAGHLHVLEYLVIQCSQLGLSSTRDLILLAIRKDRFDIFKLLVSSIGKNHFYSLKAIVEVSENGNLDLLKWINNNTTCTTDTSALDLAAKLGRLDIVRYLHLIELKERPFTQWILPRPMVISKQWSEGCTNHAFDSAIKIERLDIVNWLIANRSEGFSYKSLEYAAYNGSVELMKMLLRITTFEVTEAVMNLAVRNGRLELLKWLFENDNNSLKSILQESIDSAANNGSVDVISWLNDNTTLRNSQATIWKCMMTGKLEAVQWWLKKAAPEDDVPECIRGVIQTAARFGHIHILDWLFSNYQSIFSIDQEEFEHTMEIGDERTLRWILNKIGVPKYVTSINLEKYNTSRKTIIILKLFIKRNNINLLK
ncbi:hypothetical protein PPL_07648 [Heterostelium album PN500]|uniref:Ankyrin repeat protein n=1 Tax=Heterostelium pallidum (strain ATCC 26659 / Pp 5 / PN500) TaxID=670386 RepID=D3BGJ6_HETP5|nr:hypothetical protein PPL_07648 [Heterostelium album PN500]EFA79230.1 hypothetical protein PPL_07648 [Heterostelium album PN500]|eukprot:XP_020431351.1 hypothetical protein PPL_07648 [Heterostelium album PN500]